MQIAAIIFDTVTNKEIGYSDQLVTPTYEKILPDFFMELTGITQSDIATRGVSFSEVFAGFLEFCDSLLIWTFDKVEEVLRQNCA